MNSDILRKRQNYPLDLKIELTKRRIKEWYNHWSGKVYISFSGGKDSTVLLDLVRNIYPEVPAVFIDTGLEFPEIREFVKTFDNITWLSPKKNFKQIIDYYGFPVIGKETADKIYDIRNTKSEKLKNKRLYGDEKGYGKLSDKWVYLIHAPFKISGRCCYYLKKEPVKKFEKETNRKAIIGTLAEESSLRNSNYQRYGCNAFNLKRPISQPLSFWLNDDIWEYIQKYDLEYSCIYDKGWERTGCMFCMFGIHMDKHPNRFQLMKQTHPKQYDYCINKLGCGKVLDYIGIDYKSNSIKKLF